MNEYQNFAYSLIRRVQIFEIQDQRPDLYVRFLRLARAFESSVQSDDKLRRSLRNTLPADLSPTLVTDAERLADEAGHALREKLFILFSIEIDVALKRDKNR